MQLSLSNWRKIRKLAYALSWLSGALAFFSCIDREKELEVKLPFEGSRLVLFGLLTSTDAAAVHVTRTIALTRLQDTLASEVRDALVVLHEDGIAVDTLQYVSKGWYASAKGFRVREGRAYFVRATAQGLPEAVSEAEIVPASVKIQRVDFQARTDKRFEGILDFSFPDPPEKNNYIIQLNFFLNAAIDTASFEGRIPRGFDRTIFSDQAFNGRSHRIVQDNIFLPSLQIGNQKPVPAEKLQFSLFNVHEAYIRHLESVWRSSSAGDIDSEIPFDAPTTNVRGGYGYVGVAARDVVWVDVR